MGQSRLPVKCDRCEKQGPKKPVALKEGWGCRDLRAVTSDKPRSRAAWGCPGCLVLDREDLRATSEEQVYEDPLKAARRRSALRVLAMGSALGGFLPRGPK